MKPGFSLKLFEGGRKVWESHDEDVERLFAKNTPRTRINPSLGETIETLNKKFK